MTDPATTVADRFEIIETDVNGTRLRVFAHAPSTLRQLWDLTAAHGDATYLVYENERYTFDVTRAMVASVAHELIETLGVRKGDRVAIAMRNYPEWAVAFWAGALAGAVVVPLNAWWTGPELSYALSHAGVTVLFCDSERLERITPHLADLNLRTVTVRRGPLPNDGDHAFDDLAAGRHDLPDVALEPDDIATIMYTSGTTAHPKGAVGTHRNIGAHVMNGWWAAAQAAAGHPEPAGRRSPATLLTFPLFHVGGLHAFLIPYAAAGGKIVLLYKWDAATALDLIEREAVVGIGGVPTTLFDLLDEADRQGRTLPSLAGVASGAAPVPPRLVRQIDEQLESRAAPTNAYGLTETQGVVTVNAGEAYLSRPDSVGRPISPVVEIQIAAPGNQGTAAGTVGEILVRSPTVIREYFRDPSATVAALTDGWLHTGDLGRLDQDGFLYIVDRAKDVIIRGGENVYAPEVEAVLFEHPAVADAAVVGIPHDRLGEQVAAVVRVRAGHQVDVPELQAHLGLRLATFKVPVLVHLTSDDLPRNAAGKVLKGELRDQLREMSGGG